MIRSSAGGACLIRRNVVVSEGAVEDEEDESNE